MFRVGAAFTPLIQVKDAANQVVAESASANTSNRDGNVILQIPSSGSYTVVVGARYANQSGTYDLHFVRAPGAFEVSPSDQGGELQNGGAHPATLTLGDIDAWSFTASAGDSYMVRVGSPTFTPWIRVYGPNGELTGETTSGNTTTRDGFLTLQATNAGSYTIAVSATYAGQQGDYSIHFVRAPGALVVSEGDQGGPLENGAVHAASLTLGDLDAWSFTAAAGDNCMLRVGASQFTPWIRVYDPSGALSGETLSGNTTTRDGFLILQATNAGSYTVVVSARFNGQIGDYTLHLAKAPGSYVVSPGDQGGLAGNGSAYPASLIIGDLDLWTLNANAGDNFIVRVGAESFTPWIRVLDPAGGLAEETTSGNTVVRDGFVTFRATNAGPYTVVVSATFQGQSGNYTFSSVKAPGDLLISEGDEGGGLINGFTNTPTLNLGDLDAWTFYGTPGDSNVLRVTAVSFTPWIRVYDPAGDLIRETTSGNTAARNGSVSFNVTNAGIYTVVVAASFAGQSGVYTFKQSRFPPDLVMPEEVEIDEGDTLQINISAQDPDEPSKPLDFALLSAPAGATLTAAGPTNAVITWPTSEAMGPATNVITATVTDVVNGRAFTRTNSVTVVVREVNSAPQLVVLPNEVISELEPWSTSASAVDIDLPANPLTYALVDPPQGMTINATTGEIAWTPTEAQGPSTNEITVVVTDDNPWAFENQQLSATNTFTIIVREINTPPQLGAPGNAEIDELTTFSAVAAGADQDDPPNTLRFSLAAAPEGMTIDPVTGAITWTPTEAQGPSVNTILLVLSDDSPGAANAVSLSVTNSFVVSVREVNANPVLPPVQDQTVAELTSFQLTVTATDPDLPPNTLTYRLLSAPSGMSIDTASGAITWTPTEEQGPSTNTVTIAVADDSGGGATNSFLLVVTEQNTAPVITAIGNQSIHFDLPLSIQVTATDEDLPAQTLTFTLEQAPSGMTISPTGLIEWTPAQSQVGVYTVNIVVADSGNPPLSAATTVQVTVTGEGAVLSIERLAGGLVQISVTGDAGVEYELQGSEDLVTWTKLTDFELGASPFLYIDPQFNTISARFYRLVLIQE